MYGPIYAVKVDDLKIVEVREIEFSSEAILRSIMEGYSAVDIAGLAKLQRITKFSELEKTCRE